MKTHLDLFSGIGGFALAAQRVGFTTVAFCEKEPYAQQILKEKFGAVMADAKSGNAVHNAPKQERRPASKSADSRPRIHPDIFTLNGADYAGADLITGGFPCQPFSVAGKRRGKADDRAIWPEMLRVIAESRPCWVLGENVAGIITMELDSVLSDLEGIGYSAWPIVIPACAIDARHRRDRVWIVGWNSDPMRCSRNGGTKRTIQDENSYANGIRKDVADASRIQPGLEDKRPERERTGQCGESIDVADTARQLRHRAGISRNGSGQFANGGETISDDGCGSGEMSLREVIGESQPARWEPEPELGRVAHGIPNRAHRLRGLGNAIVPQVAQEILSAISQII